MMPAATEESPVAMLSHQDAVAPKFRVRHVPSKEEYLYITWSGQAGATKAIRHAEYGKAQRRDKHRGIWVLGSQVLSEAAATGLRHRFRGAVAEWATATIHLAAVRGIARVFTEQVLAQVVTRTRGGHCRLKRTCIDWIHVLGHTPPWGECGGGGSRHISSWTPARSGRSCGSHSKYAIHGQRCTGLQCSSSYGS